MNFWRRGWQRLDTGDAEARAIFLHALEAVGVAVAGDDAALILHSRGDEGCFATGRRAEVEHGFARLRIENMNREECARVLHIEPAVAETAETDE